MLGPTPLSRSLVFGTRVECKQSVVVPRSHCHMKSACWCSSCTYSWFVLDTSHAESAGDHASQPRAGRITAYTCGKKQMTGQVRCTHLPC